MKGPLLSNHTHKFVEEGCRVLACVYCTMWLSWAVVELAARQDIRLKGVAIASPEAQAFLNRLVNEDNNKHS